MDQVNKEKDKKGVGNKRGASYSNSMLSAPSLKALMRIENQKP